MMALFGSSCALLSGCGGQWSGSASGGSGFAALNGTVTLPSGVAASELVLTSSQGASPLTTTAYVASVSSDSPSLVMAVHSATGKVIHMAMVDPTSGSANLNPNSTAVALLYLGLGGAMLSGTDRRSLLNKVAGSSEVSGLANTIASAQATDKFALSNGSAALKAKVQSAIRAAVTGLAKSAAKADDAQSRAIAPQLIIEPAAEVDGMTMVQTSPGIGFQVENKHRRSGTAFTYRVGHVADDGSVTPENPPKQVGSGEGVRCGAV